MIQSDSVAGVYLLIIIALVVIASKAPFENIPEMIGCRRAVEFD